MPPFSPLHLIIFVFALVLLIALVQIGLVSIAFEKLGLSSSSAFLLLFCSLIGSAINLPLFTMKSAPPQNGKQARYYGLIQFPLPTFTGHTRVTVNVGGGLIPVLFSIYLIRHNAIPGSDLLLTIAAMTAVSYFISRPIQGIGIGMPILIAPLCAAVIAMLTNPDYSAPLAYIGGTLGVLVGADILRINSIRKMGLPFASIGGAGTFDGIFITGLVAVLLA
jgi:uncharacterized membrane protein